MLRNVNKATLTQAKFGSITSLKSDIFRASQGDDPIKKNKVMFK